MNGVVLLVGGLLLVAVIKLIIDGCQNRTTGMEYRS